MATLLLLAVVAAAAAAALAGPSGPASPPSGGSADGPLHFPTGYAVVLRPMDGESFFVLEACLEGTDGEVEITAARGDGGEVFVNFDGPTAIGAGSAAEMSKDFVTPAPGVIGEVSSCATPPGTVVEFAVVLPEAIHEDVQIDGFSVTYEVDGETYEEAVDARFTTCASAPKDRPDSACA